MAYEAFAPAKVNLFLHVGPLGADGFHPICSLMVFADVGDTLVLTLGAGPRLRIKGPFGAALAADDANLVARGRLAILSTVVGPLPPFSLTLTKRLPLAAGLGGGSSDGAATLTLIDRALALGITPATMAALAANLGADVPACIEAKPVIACGRGEVLEAAPPMPVLHAVLVNPGVPSPTASVFRTYDRAGVHTLADRPGLPNTFETAAELAAALALCRNDLEAPAIGREPIIGEALTMMRSQPQTLIARLSGSGATCFALCATAAGARDLALRVAALQPSWWTQTCRLGGPWR